MLEQNSECTIFLSSGKRIARQLRSCKLAWAVVKLAAAGVEATLDLSLALRLWVRQHLTVIGERIVTKLNEVLP